MLWIFARVLLTQAAALAAVARSVEAMRLKKPVVEQLIMVTDEGENSAPYFVDADTNYCRSSGVILNVVSEQVMLEGMRQHHRHLAETEW
ncbi:hypothetical protein [Microcoleus sp.]|uniref:hypothetical protein n=1 Tax=Microcoleus sp. TaxID=44472 RepID=UPI003C729262